MSYEDKKSMWSKLKLERVNGPMVGNCRGIVLKCKSSNNNNVLDSNKEVDFNKKKRLDEDAKRLGIFFWQTNLDRQRLRSNLARHYKCPKLKLLGVWEPSDS